jgi:hypothetical protein
VEPKQPYHLFLDDERSPKDVYWVQYAATPHFQDPAWVIVRTYRDFVATIENKGLPQAVSFDHDLQDFENGSEFTGSTCARWLAEYCLDHNQLLPAYIFHSQNGEGVKTMESILDSCRRVQAM